MLISSKAKTSLSANGTAQVEHKWDSMEPVRRRSRFVLAVFLYLCSLVLTYVQAWVSYSANGTWEQRIDAQKWCDQFLCVGKNRIFQPSSQSDFRLYNSSEGCRALLAKGVRRINFHGDSYMRQIYAAMLITLRGDYRYGSIADPQKTPECEYQSQFNEKHCGLYQLNHYGSACDGQLKLDPLLNGLDNLNDCKSSSGTVSLWSFGNHKLAPGRWGVNNASIYSSVFSEKTCPLIKEAKEQYTEQTYGTYASPCSIWWISTHHRLVGYFDDEKEPVVHRFNKEMREFFDSGKCGVVNYVDVFNMTDRLVLDHNEEALAHSYDRVHWGMEVNLWKAQIIINALVSMPSPATHSTSRRASRVRRV